MVKGYGWQREAISKMLSKTEAIKITEEYIISSLKTPGIKLL